MKEICNPQGEVATPVCCRLIERRVSLLQDALGFAL